MSQKSTLGVRKRSDSYHPDSYIGRITRIDRFFDGNTKVCFFSKREGFIREYLHVSLEDYVKEFPGRPIEVASFESIALPTQ